MATPISSPSSELFLDAEPGEAIAAPPSAARSRLVKINLALLLDDQGQARDLGAGAEIRINLFPDVTYTGVIEQVESNGDGYSWMGYLKDIEYSGMTIVYTSGLFIGQFASPAGIYEVSSVGDELYRIILVDQAKFQGGEDYIKPTPTAP